MLTTEVSIGFHSTALIEARGLGRQIIALFDSTTDSHVFSNLFSSEKEYERYCYELEQLTTQMLFDFIDGIPLASEEYDSFFFASDYVDNLNALVRRISM